MLLHTFCCLLSFVLHIDFILSYFGLAGFYPAVFVGSKIGHILTAYELLTNYLPICQQFLNR